MQERLDHYQRGVADNQTQSQVSFRDTKPEMSFKSFNNQDSSAYHMNDHHDIEAKISQMMSEAKELKTRLKTKDDQITFEKENNVLLMDKINRMNEAFQSELVTYKKECNLLQDEIRQREMMMGNYKQQVEMVSQTANLEFPIVILRDDKENENNINLSNQRVNPQQQTQRKN